MQPGIHNVQPELYMFNLNIKCTSWTLKCSTYFKCPTRTLNVRHNVKCSNQALARYGRLCSVLTVLNRTWIYPILDNFECSTWTLKCPTWSLKYPIATLHLFYCALFCSNQALLRYGRLRSVYTYTIVPGYTRYWANIRGSTWTFIRSTWTLYVQHEH